jgi:carboxypeptidase family protein
VLAAFLLVAATLIAADTLTGEARGNILDVENNLPIFSASVTLTNVERGWKQQQTSNADGNYVFIQLEPGTYSLRAEREGYYPSDKQEIFIRLNTPKVVVPPFRLRKLVTTPTQQITVTSEGLSRNLLIDATSAGPSPTVLATLSEPGARCARIRSTGIVCAGRVPSSVFLR